MDFTNLPSHFIEFRKAVLHESSNEVLSLSTEYIVTKYKQLDKLEAASRFCSYTLLDAARTEGDNFLKLGFFPWVEASQDFDKALSLIMLTCYKNSFDSLRRSLELIAIGSFYADDETEAKNARAWIKSKKDTPNFKRVLEKLVKEYPYSLCEKQLGLMDFLLSLYYRLSDFIHVKGINKSHRKFTPSFHYLNGVSEFVFNENSCKESLDIYLETVEAVALLCALCNPTLLIGLDLERKFGLSTPISGFLEEHQSERLRFLIPKKFVPFIDELMQQDENIKSTNEWFESLPDISEEELKQQCEAMDNLIKRGQPFSNE